MPSLDDRDDCSEDKESGEMRITMDGNLEASLLLRLVLGIVYIIIIDCQCCREKAGKPWSKGPSSTIQHSDVQFSTDHPRMPRSFPSVPPCVSSLPLLA